MEVIEMMSVKEYAIDVNKSVDAILKLCKEMNINVNNEDDMLDEEAITELDNLLATQSDEEGWISSRVCCCGYCDLVNNWSNYSSFFWPCNAWCILRIFR